MAPGRRARPKGRRDRRAPDRARDRAAAQSLSLVGTTSAVGRCLESDGVRREIAAASRHRKTMIPVMQARFDSSVEAVKGAAGTLVRFGGQRILDRQNRFVPEPLQRSVRGASSRLAEAP